MSYHPEFIGIPRAVGNFIQHVHNNPWTPITNYRIRSLFKVRDTLYTELLAGEIDVVHQRVVMSDNPYIRETMEFDYGVLHLRRELPKAPNFNQELTIDDTDTLYMSSVASPMEPFDSSNFQHVSFLGRAVKIARKLI